jgi:hypothetical protein
MSALTCATSLCPPLFFPLHYGRQQNAAVAADAYELQAAIRHCPVSGGAVNIVKFAKLVHPERNHLGQGWCGRFLDLSVCHVIWSALIDAEAICDL